MQATDPDVRVTLSGAEDEVLQLGSSSVIHNFQATAESDSDHGACLHVHERCMGAQTAMVSNCEL
jgi:hypothetical protein